MVMALLKEDGSLDVERMNTCHQENDSKIS